MYHLIDSEAFKGQATSRFLTRREYPEMNPRRRLNFIFRHKRFVDIKEDKVAYKLVNKYPSVHIVDDELNNLSIKDDLDEMKLNDLRHVCREYGINSFQMGLDDMRMAIRKARLDGVERRVHTKKEAKQERFEKNLERLKESNDL